MNSPNSFSSLQQTDPEINDLINEQMQNETNTLKMIASENYASLSVLEATGSALTNKYAEGYPGKRYYEGNTAVDKVEELAKQRAKDLFGAEHANVQPYSGSPANQAVYKALLNSGDKIMGMPVPMGGHLTHGWSVNFSGTEYEQIPYGPDPTTGMIDMSQVRSLAKKHKPKMIWVGATAYPRVFDYAEFAEIAHEVRAYLVADIAHIAGLVAGDQHPNPVPHVDIVTSTSHKTLRGPRGGFILSKEADQYKDEYHPDDKYDLAKRIDRAVFPHLQGGPHMNVVAAMAVAFKEANTEGFKQYAEQIVKNTRALADALLGFGHALVSGGSDNHLLIMDFKEKSYSGKKVAKRLAKSGIITNFNMVPGDHRKPMITSGVRIGTPALTSRGMKEDEMKTVASLINEVCENLDAQEAYDRVRAQVKELCSTFKVPGITG